MLTTENAPQTAEQINSPQLGQITTANDNPGENVSDSQNSTLEKLRSAVGQVVSKWKPGRGRPRKDGAPKKSDVALEIQPENPATAAPVAATHSDSAITALFRRSIVSGCKGVLGILKALVRIKADAADIDEKFTDKALRECEPEPQDLENFSESLQIVLDKYNVKSEKAPEICCAINGLKLAAPLVLLFSTFNAEIKRKRAREIAAQNGGAK